MTHARPALTQDFPLHATFDAQPGEASLRGLYAHPHKMVRLGMIAAANGKASGPDGSSRSLNGPEDLRILLVLRSLADVVVVGAATALTERYGDLTLPEDLSATRTAGSSSPAPALALVTRSGEMPAGLSPERTWLITTADAPAASSHAPWASRTMVAGATRLDLRLAVRQLHDRGLSRVLCEGGPTLATQMMSQGVVDDYCLTTSAVDGMGRDTPPVPPRA
ncbi:MAG: dihydrofolate reductase family protein, partial [Demequina sp.]